VTEEQPRGGPTVRRMLLGARLRRLRTEAGVSREDAGEAIRASAWKLHRLENGQVSYKERDIIDLLRRYGVTDPGEIDTFLALAREANQPGWWTPYSDLLPEWFRAYVDLEAVATLIRSYEALFVPGLLQTEEYMRALMRATLHDRRPEEIERRVKLRLNRQQLLTRPDPPRLWAVMDEAALRRAVGGTKVLRAQIERLIEAAALPNVSLQVVPFTTGAHPAMVGAFSILRFAEPDLPDVVYLEHLTGALHLDKPEDVEGYRQIWSNAGLHGAPPEQAAEVLSELLRGLS
jgi:transcriptional regulator with XRE-family HTH domain